ncbi:MAG: sigma-70 family RNA polymerase sigma factor [Pseudomonadota bacterium]
MRAHAVMPALTAPLDDDDAVLRAIEQRDEAAFEQVVDAHLPSVIAVARRVLGDAGDAQDVAQDVLLRLWTRPSAARPDSGVEGSGDGSATRHVNIGAWLRRSAVNAAIDRWRRAQRMEPFDPASDEADAPVPAEQLDALERDDVASRVRSAIALLPERQRVVCTLFHLDHLPVRDVAAALHVSERAVESLLSRARRTLKRTLAPEIEDMIGVERGDDAKNADRLPKERSDRSPPTEETM